MMDAGLPSVVAIEGWVGPLNGIQDFVLGGGAVEVKTTIATAGFPATIGSLDQLDDSIRQPLFLAAVRIRLDPSGMSLPAIIEDTRTLLSEDPAAQHMLNVKLIHAGYLDAVSEHYKRDLRTCIDKDPSRWGWIPSLLQGPVFRHRSSRSVMSWRSMA